MNNPKPTQSVSPTIPWSAHLAVATDAVVAASDLLRAEFHRPDGPRGSGGSCPVDAEIELFLGLRLREAFPDIPIVGEEVHRDAAGGGPCWVIDPHDGTSRFLLGERGTSISVGLMVDQEPVLGVVAAPLYPDDDGDLITWTIGGTLRRRGLEVNRGGWAADLTSTTMLISASESARIQHWCTAMAPGRVRVMPSIAYRLALVAVGEADATLTTHGVSAYDVAAGHALLLGAGGDLVDRTGQPLRYRADGFLPSCVGGGGACRSRIIAGQSTQPATRSVVALRSPPRPRPDWLTPMHLIPGRSCPDARRLAKAQGCLLGVIAGDNLGALVEFRGAVDIARQYPSGPNKMADGGTWNLMAGQPTDDGEQALCLARTLVHHGPDLHRRAEAYACWYTTAFDIGGTTRAALSPAADAWIAGGDALAAATSHANAHSQANGSLMRCAPLGIYGCNVPLDDLITMAKADAAITHPHQLCQDACAVYVAGIAAAIAEDLDGPATVQRMKRVAVQFRVPRRIIEAIDQAYDQPIPHEGDENQGWVILALQNAVHRALSPDPVQALVDTVRMGGDTDTTAAIAGGLLGAIHGRDTWPQQWRDRILSCHNLPAGPSRHPQPPHLWPVDVMVLAERLLIAATNHGSPMQPADNHENHSHGLAD